MGLQDTLEVIAKQYNTTEAKIAEVNHETIAGEMEAGDFVIIPVAYPGAAQDAQPTRAKAAKPAPSRNTVAVRPAAKKPPVPTKQAAKPAVSGKTRTVATAARRPVRRES